MDFTSTIEASPCSLRIVVANHSYRSRFSIVFGIRYPELPSGTAPKRWSFLQTVTRKLAPLFAKLNTRSNQGDLLSETVKVITACYIHNSQLMQLGSPRVGKLSVSVDPRR
jgi:hypothetical protein